MMFPFDLSDNLNHTWFIDLDGTILKHNGYLTDEETLLPGVKELWDKIPIEDTIIITTSRKSSESRATENFLALNEIRFNHIIYDLPTGERVLINDIKPQGLNTSIAWNVERNKGYK